jgi:hypothetical protein
MPPDIRAWLTKRPTLAVVSVGRKRGRPRLSLSAIKSVQDLGDQRQGDDGYRDNERRTCSFGQSPQRIADDGN